MSHRPERPLPTMSRPALLVVDMSYGFVDPACSLGTTADEAVHAARRLLDTFRQRGLPRCFSTVAYARPDQARVFREVLPPLDDLAEGSRWVKLHEALGRQDDEPVLVKQYPSMFFATGLDRQLREQNVDSVVVCGLTTSGCVRATVVDAMSHEFRPIVVREAVADRDPRSHDVSLSDMAAKYAWVTSLETCIAALPRPQGD